MHTFLSQGMDRNGIYQEHNLYRDVRRTQLWYPNYILLHDPEVCQELATTVFISTSKVFVNTSIREYEFISIRPPQGEAPISRSQASHPTAAATHTRSRRSPSDFCSPLSPTLAVPIPGSRGPHLSLSRAHGSLSHDLSLPLALALAHPHGPYLSLSRASSPHPSPTTSRGHSFRDPARALFLVAHAFSVSALAPCASHGAYLAVTTLAALSWASISWLTSSPSSQPPLSQAPFSRFYVTLALILAVLFLTAPILTAPPCTHHSRDLVLAALVPSLWLPPSLSLFSRPLSGDHSVGTPVVSGLATRALAPFVAAHALTSTVLTTLAHDSRPCSRGFVSCGPHPRGARSRPHFRISAPWLLSLPPFLRLAPSWPPSLPHSPRSRLAAAVLAALFSPPLFSCPPLSLPQPSPCNSSLGCGHDSRLAPLVTSPILVSCGPALPSRLLPSLLHSRCPHITTPALAATVLTTPVLAASVLASLLPFSLPPFSWPVLIAPSFTAAVLAASFSQPPSLAFAGLVVYGETTLPLHNWGAGIVKVLHMDNNSLGVREIDCRATDADEGGMAREEGDFSEADNKDGAVSSERSCSPSPTLVAAAPSPSPMTPTKATSISTPRQSSPAIPASSTTPLISTSSPFVQSKDSIPPPRPEAPKECG
ncbi:hypothetical protein BOTBODRAFT_174019 [Botryobasidium botryosum FD-172 SS1]|uniref:Uncharacterized protein n=1 Tax=Botryobasidium botryosum (strain FD-172 SS1) TaxID=930990 RepID=A0A067MUB1_BOTB1|nr:hypothetical protein BOTBODRAFT_174019 [Botryobasidium botryosum FD-172 SS1]